MSHKILTDHIQNIKAHKTYPLDSIEHDETCITRLGVPVFYVVSVERFAQLKEYERRILAGDTNEQSKF